MFKKLVLDLLEMLENSCNYKFFCSFIYYLKLNLSNFTKKQQQKNKEVPFTIVFSIYLPYLTMFLNVNALWDVELRS